MKLKTIYLCGDSSRYGLAHLNAIWEEFDIVAVVIGTDKTWSRFRNALKGGEQYEQPANKIDYIYRLARKYLPDFFRKVIKKTNTVYVQEFCKSKNINLLKIDDVNDPDFIHSLNNFNFDVLLSAAYPQILKKGILSIAPRGSINFHPSLLPRYRGAHPHFWSIAKGEDLGGITAHFMTEKIDNGDIVAQISFPINEYYYNELYDKIEAESHNLVKKVRVFLENEENPIKQDETKVVYYRNDREIHRRIFWESMSAQQIYNLIRTESAFFFVHDKIVFPKRARIVDNNRNITNDVYVPPGVIVDITPAGITFSTKETNQFLCIECFSEKILILQRKGIIPWARRHKVLVGMKLN